MAHDTEKTSGAPQLTKDELEKLIELAKNPEIAKILKESKKSKEK